MHRQSGWQRPERWQLFWIGNTVFQTTGSPNEETLKTHTHLVWAYGINKEFSQNQSTWEGQDLLHCSHSRNKLRSREMLGSIPTLPVHAWHSDTMAMNQFCRENTNHSFSTVEVWCYQAWKSSTKTEKLISWNESSLKTGIYSLNFYSMLEHIKAKSMFCLIFCTKHIVNKVFDMQGFFLKQIRVQMLSNLSLKNNFCQFFSCCLPIK